MKYPYIGELLSGTGGVAIFLNDYTAAPLNDSGDNWRESEIFTYSCYFHSPSFKNITHEYLANTYGEVKSPEHAEFIIELAELHGIKRAFTSPMKTINAFAFKGGNLYLYGMGLDELTQLPTRKITIPLPPKADKQESSEWPKVGSIVTWGNKSVKGEVKALSDGLAWIKNEYGNYCSEYVSSLQKPKTPEEELHEWMQERIGNGIANNFDCEQITHDLLHHLDIKKKPQ